MANNGADIYLILLRPTRVPVLGEAVSMLFQGQVLLESLRWNLHNEDERKRAGKIDKKYNETKSRVDRQGSAHVRREHAHEELAQGQAQAIKDRDRALAAANGNVTLINAALSAYDKRLSSLDKTHWNAIVDIDGGEKMLDKKDEQTEARNKLIEELDRNKNFEFTFTKRVDIASTQLLNSMKAGDIFPSGTLTIHQRSATMMDGTSLVFNIQRIRLLDYQLQVAVTDTMTEMTEVWTAEFGALAYVYKNPPSHYSHGNAGQAVAKTLSQGTMRAFTMKNIGSPI